MRCTECSSREAIGVGPWELPPHTARAFRRRGTRYAVIVPVWNEGARLRAQLAAMHPYLDDCDLIIADSLSSDGSTDPGTLEAAGVRALVSVEGPGMSPALRASIAHAVIDGYEGVILMDGNNKDDPEMLSGFARALGAGADYAQGSRYIPGGRGINTPLMRHVVIRYFHSPIFSLLCGRWFTDATVGSRAFSRQFLLDPRVRPFRRVFVYYDLYFYLAWAACRLGFRVTDVPVTRTYPASGPVPTKITSIRAYWRMIRPLVMIALRRFN